MTAIPVPLGSTVTITQNENAPQSSEDRKVYVRRGQLFEELPYKRRLGFTFCGNNYLKFAAFFWVAALAVGIGLEVTSPKTCPDGCQTILCQDQLSRVWPCTCSTLSCENQHLAGQGIAGVALIALGACGIIMQSLLACTCFLCWLPAEKFTLE